MDDTNSNDYQWQTVIKTKDDRYLIKGGYVKIGIGQTIIPGVNTGTLAIAGLYDTIAKTYVWLKAIRAGADELPIISALALNFNEDTLVLAGTGLSARNSYYFFVEPMTGVPKYPMFKA